MVLSKQLYCRMEQHLCDARPGEHGKFTESFIAGLESYGEVKTSTATGAVAVRLNEGDPLPNAPQLTDIVMNEDASRYFVTDAAQGYTGGKANGDLSTVARYALSASDENTVFTVHYLDRETGAVVAIVVIAAIVFAINRKKSAEGE